VKFWANWMMIGLLSKFGYLDDRKQQSIRFKVPHLSTTIQTSERWKGGGYSEVKG
jgi:hypothetical protein